ncbi:MAG: hypothetical protein A07HR60_00528 [uncultured archaeon A07HR60]|nr:MAG: hypothetical protein A07HR60_00528 [uncultured archaeon A07HR60]
MPIDGVEPSDAGIGDERACTRATDREVNTCDPDNAWTRFRVDP